MTRAVTDNPQFYLTAPAPCPYLEGKHERKVFTHLVGEHAPALNDVLTHGGFRRSQNIAYRPACEDCHACTSVRILVDQFKWTKSFRRALKLGRSLVGEQLPAAPSGEQYDLFRLYLDARHAAGGMADMGLLDYALMIEDTHVNTIVVEYRERLEGSGLDRARSGKLVAAALTDVLSDGLSMVYSFFDPDFTKMSIGTFLILDHIERARRMGLPYVYLGYWVSGSRKMDYKTRFQPQEYLGSQGWTRFD
ncbi:arginyltransferase [Breoghania sp. L-A4]|uniref:arginyltransferase n=1 Tax=Breoghania sp. L-A4 TaxID=2304600 RepID=UPI000E35EF7F|nr:arginyltransferase [Breoghania sp. L-A4]AXS40250.1 arginyltransferase [Breoghania sp. L-A4]